MTGVLENSKPTEGATAKEEKEKKEVRRPKRNNQFHLFTLVIFIY
jgi:hypothetical protein